MNRSVMSLYLLGCASTLPFAANAQHVYKCVDGSSVSYQSEPCGEAGQLARQWEATPDPEPSVEQLARQRQVQAQGEQESAYLRALARRGGTGAGRQRATGVAISAARDGDRCARAKKRRDETERRLGLKRTFESMRRLSTLVYEACR